MNESTNQVVEVDLKDLLCYILKHTTILTIVSIVFVLFGVGYSFIMQTKSSDAPVTNVLDTSVKLPGESDEAYYNRVANIERAYDIMENIAVLNKQVEIQGNYINNSAYMQIDPLNTAMTKIQVTITCDNSVDGGLNSLFKAYSNDILTGDYINEVADDLNYSSGVIEELINCEFTYSNSAYSESNIQMGVMGVSVVGESVDITDYIMDAIVAELEVEADTLNCTIMPHSISIVGRQSSVGFDVNVRKTQIDSITTLNTIQTQINNLNNNLDSIAKVLGLNDRTSFYDSSVVSTTSESGVSVTGCIKSGLIGFVLGLALVALIYALIYVFGHKFVSQTQFFSVYKDVNRIGVLKPSNKRTKLQVILDNWSNDDSSLTPENTFAIINANLTNMTIEKKKLLITGTVDSDYVKESIKSIGLKGDIRLDMFNDPSIVKGVSDYDGVVLIEQRGASRRKLVNEQIRLLKTSGVEIIGAIIL